jgi:hypothetical protein
MHASTQHNAACFVEDLAKVLRADLELHGIAELDRVGHDLGSAGFAVELWS